MKAAKPLVPQSILHTDKTLRKHKLLVKQTGFGRASTFVVIDWKTHRPASAKRVSAFMSAIIPAPFPPPPSRRLPPRVRRSHDDN